jgi:hypothetical protein
VIDDHHMSRQLVGLLQVLGGEKDVGPVGDEIANPAPELHAAARVEASGRLV